MKLNRLAKPGEMLLPLTILAFAGPGISYVNVILNTATRWLLLLILTLYVISAQRKDVLSAIRSPFMWAALLYGFWCFLTSFWSEIPTLSFIKSIGFNWLAFTFMFAGYSWVQRNDYAKIFDFFLLFAIVTLLAAVSGTAIQNEQLGVELYGGMTGNPNYLGVLLAASSLWLFWHLFLAKSGIERYLFAFLLIMDFIFLLKSMSRSSLLAFALAFSGFAYGIGLKKFLPWVSLGVVVALLLAVINPSATEEIAQHYIFKANPEYLESLGALDAAGGGLLFSRQEVWDISYELAMMGGLFGGGYGVTIGEQLQGDLGFSISSGEYGREQGNTQLAIIEQTGFVGLVLYGLLLLSLFLSLLMAFMKARLKLQRVAIGLVAGMIIGMLVQSVFEAWWVAPGAMESAIFWTLAGAAIGLGRRIQRENKTISVLLPSATKTEAAAE